MQQNRGTIFYRNSWFWMFKWIQYLFFFQLLVIIGTQEEYLSQKPLNLLKEQITFTLKWFKITLIVLFWSCHMLSGLWHHLKSFLSHIFWDDIYICPYLENTRMIQTLCLFFSIRKLCKGQWITLVAPWHFHHTVQMLVLSSSPIPSYTISQHQQDVSAKSFESQTKLSWLLWKRKKRTGSLFNYSYFRECIETDSCD